MLKFTMIFFPIFLIGCKSLNIKMADRTDGRSAHADSTPIHDGEINSQQAPRKIKKVGVIIGPGLAKTMTSVHFFEALNRYEFDIKAFAGIGWGAIPAAIYSHRLKPKELDWQFYKLSQNNILKTNFFGQEKKQIDSSRQENFLVKIFKEKKLSSFQYPFFCPYKSKNGVSLFSQGIVAPHLNRCAMAVSQGVSSFEKQSRLIFSVMDQFYDLGVNHVIFVNFNSDQAHKLENLFQSLEVKSPSSEALEFSLINVPTDFIVNTYDFKNSKKIISNSASNVNARLKALSQQLR